jgi:DNA-binding CsgD family transcriptional regulator
MPAGRAAVLAALRAATGGTVLLSGPPDTGPARLAEEALRDRPGAVWVHCPPGADPLWPWLRLLSRLGRPADGLPGEGFARVAALADRLLAAAPWTAVVEDADEADPESLRLLAYLARELPGTGALLVVTARDPAVLAGAARARAALSLRLEPDPAGLAELLASAEAAGPDAAAGLLEQALRLLEHDPEQRCEVLVRLAGAEYLAGRPRRAGEHCLAAAELAAATGRPDQLVAAALVVGGAGDPDVAVRAALLCERALAAVPGPSRAGVTERADRAGATERADRADRAEGTERADRAEGAEGSGGTERADRAEGAEGSGGTERADRARLLARGAALHADAGTLTEAQSIAALDAAERDGDDGALLDAVRARMALVEEPAERLRLGGVAARTGLRSGQLLAAARGELWRVDARYMLADLRGADESLARLADLARAAGRPVADWHARRAAAARAALAGRWGAAREANAAAHEAARRTGDRLAAATTATFAMLVALVRGDPAGLDERAAPPDEAGPVAALWWLVAGHRPEARARYERLRHGLRDLPPGVHRFVPLQQLTELALAFGDAEAAAWAYPHWRPWIAAGGLPGNADGFCGGAPARPAGRLAALLGRPGEAAELLRAAIEVNTVLDAGPWLVHARLDLAGLAGAPGADVSPAAAADLAARAARDARRLDLPGPLARAAALDPLTAREREIAGLVAQALSNRDIAARLVLSERTVESHVRHILTKLGLANRTALTAHHLRDR